MHTLDKDFYMSQITDTVSIIIATVALGMTFWQGVEMRDSYREIQKYNRLSFQPFLTHFYSTKKGYYRFELINNGPGLAFLENPIIKVDGQQLIGENRPLEKSNHQIIS